MPLLIIKWVLLALGAELGVGGWFWRKSAVRVYDAEPTKPQKKKKTLATLLMVVGAWLFAEQLLRVIFGTEQKGKFTVEIWAPRVTLAGQSVSTTVLITWAIMAVVLVLSLAFRIFAVPRMKDEPRGLQNAVEIAVEYVRKYTESKVGDLGDGLPSFLFAVVVFMVGCAAVELFGFRAPTADITMTFALALTTLFCINYYGFKKKGLGGRLKRYFPNVMNFVSDIAAPVSLACRLFGNMLGGMIVMDLLYSALGNAAIGFPSLAGLYFNLFHPLIQTYIFITLSLTFIGEAVE